MYIDKEKECKGSRYVYKNFAWPIAAQYFFPKEFLLDLKTTMDA